PENAGGEGAMLVEGHQRTEAFWRQVIEKDRRGSPAARHVHVTRLLAGLFLWQTSGEQLFLRSRGGASGKKTFGLGEGVGEECASPLPVAGACVERRNELDRAPPRALMEELVEGVLTERADRSPYDRRGRA